MARAGRGKMVQLLGEAELEKRLRMLADTAKGKELRRATMAGAAVVRREAKRLAPVRSDPRLKGREQRGPGNLKKNIGTSSRVVSPTRVSTSIGLRKWGYYGRWVELGHALVKGGRKGKKGRTISHVPAKPFLRPALEQHVKEVVARAQLVFSRNIDKVTSGNR